MITGSTSRYKCRACGKSPFKFPGLSVHRCPKDAEQRIEWLKALNLTTVNFNTYKICSDHFDKNCFVSKTKIKNLKPGAVPTIFTKKKFESPTLGEKSEDKNEGSTMTLEESSNEEEVQFCPPSMERFDIPNDPRYPVLWCCKNCKTCILSKDAVLKHLSASCRV